MTDSPRTMISIRIPADQLAEIDRRADAAGMSRTDYLLRAALDSDPVDARLAAIERRLKTMEKKL